MNSLVAYGGSDSDSSGNEDIPSTPTHGIIPKKPSLNMPSSSLPSKSNTSSNLRASATVESDPPPARHDWELAAAAQLKRKLLAKKNSKQPVRIVLPEISGDLDEDSDDEYEKQVAAKKSSKPAAIGAGSSSLLAFLPAARAPIKDKSANNGRSGSSVFIPASLSRPAAKAQKAVKRPAAVAKDNSDSDDDDQATGTDLLGLDTNMDSHSAVPQGFFEAESSSSSCTAVSTSSSTNSAPAVSTAFIHPSQLYNLANYDQPLLDDSPQQHPMTNEAGPKQKKPKVFDDAQARRLIARNEEATGVIIPNVNSVDIVDVNIDHALGPNVRANLLKNLTSRPGMVQPLTSEKKKKEDDPGCDAKRKHQITYLAFMAKQQEEKLKEQWSNNKFARRQTQNKYGF